MRNDVFKPANILLPTGVAPEKWSVVACDQFSSEREYWDRVRKTIKDAPSTLHMILPEAYLEEIDEADATAKISAVMSDYISRGIFNEIKDSFVYVERTQADGRVRRGIVGAVNLDEYDFSGKKASILASEGTVVDRLPARIRVRRAASLELPHIMAFIDDKDESVIEPLAKIAADLPVLYDFELMEGGGHIRGFQVQGSAAEGVLAAMRALHEKNEPLMVMGDGNHSLAAAKVYWDELKQTLSESERANHPARCALLEINNVYDGAISFEAIHRVLFGVNPAEALAALESAVPKGSDYEVRWISGRESGVIGIAADCIGDMLTDVQTFLDEYAARTGCVVDYIHGDESVAELSKNENRLGLILPPMDKGELFETVALRGVFPKKSFSVGHAHDKRYYLECRSIV